MDQGHQEATDMEGLPFNFLCRFRDLPRRNAYKEMKRKGLPWMVQIRVGVRIGTDFYFRGVCGEIDSGPTLWTATPRRWRFSRIFCGEIIILIKMRVRSPPMERM